ncbi:MAG: hypothetical protein QOI56_204 [Actinomycetota bacterium]|jgi:hypothetical protein|nr:hypothetical protein [Actinomycetota bacterium]
MGEVQEPQGRVGGDYREGTNPYPGGTVDTGDTPVPPYEGRSTGPDDTESTRAKTDSIERQLDETVSKGDSEQGQVKSPGGENISPTTGEELGDVSAGANSGGASEIPDPHGVGESDSQRGETFEPPASEHKGATQRPVGQVEGDLMEPNNSGSGTSGVD